MNDERNMNNDKKKFDERQDLRGTIIEFLLLPRFTFVDIWDVHCIAERSERGNHLVLARRAYSFDERRKRSFEVCNVMYRFLDGKQK